MLQKRLFKLLLICIVVAPSYAQGSVLGAVATQHPLATKTAAHILKQGGNAMDAAVAAALTLAVVEPYNSGLGAGGMALIWDGKRKKAHGLDFRETAPGQTSATLYTQSTVPADASRNGPLAIAVPGEVAGLSALHQKWGRLPWAVLFEDAIHLAETGFIADTALIERAHRKKTCLQRDYHTWKIYRPILQPEPGLLKSSPETNMFPKTPILWMQKDLANTLKRLQNYGAKDFYHGQLADQIVSNLQGKGALLRRSDLANYRVIDRVPIVGKFSWGKVWGFPLPSSGGISILRALNTLEALSKKNTSYQPWPRWLVQILGPVFETRNTEMGDPAFVKALPVRKWISKSFAKKQAELLLTNPAQPKAENTNLKNQGHTTHLSVLDAEGNAVSMTLTQNLSFGSCVTAGNTGILLNNQMDDFATNPGKPNAFGLVQSSANAVASGKRPLSSMSPTLVTEKKTVILAIGSPGGPRIITSVLQVLYRHFVLGEKLKHAIAAPRIHYQGLPKHIDVETGTDQKTLEKLRPLSIPIMIQKPWSNIQAVAYDPINHQLSAFSDPRGIGRAIVVQSH